MNALELCSWSFHTQSRLSSSEVRFRGKRLFCVFEPPWGRA